MLLHGPLTYESSHKSNLLLFLYCWIIIFQRIICISNNIVIIKSVIKLLGFRIIFLTPVSRSICCYCSVAELCLTLCNPMNCVACQAPLSMGFCRILEWIAISLSRGSSQTRDWTHISCIGRQILYHRALREVIYMCVCACVKFLQSCPTLCDHMACSPPGSSVNGILQARILEWIAMPSFRWSSWPRDQTHIFYVSHIGTRVLYH